MKGKVVYVVLGGYNYEGYFVDDFKSEKKGNILNSKVFLKYEDAEKFKNEVMNDKNRASFDYVDIFESELA